MTQRVDQVREDYEHIKGIFLELIELPRERRAEELDDRCAGDARVRAAVQSLLDAHDDDRASRLQPTSAPEHHRTNAGMSSLSTRQIGPYKILQEIGEGGFGTVYMAEQEQPVRRRLALKLIKLGMDTKQVIARFEAERQALAMMDHPNIARVFDAGATETGRPYFVMELVKGIPITEYCDKNHLDIRQRLELFAQICQAVQHAHQKGIIHRDIKPNNILVSTEDGRPLAKVIDFGVAKATDDRLTEKTLYTEFHQLIGTPEFMSPEQAEGSLDIDTRSDIYSLGVVMYELLTGSTPFDPSELRSKAYPEIQRMIREVEPPNPSARLYTLRQTLPAVAAQRRIEPRRLGQLVRGELDWIVMKCLEKDRSRRYETASALGSDVARYLADEPVIAGPPSKLYKLRKLVRRNRGLFTAAAVISVVLVAGIVGITLAMLRAQRAERLAVKNAEEARQSLATADAVIDYIRKDLFRQASPSYQADRDVTLRTVLDSAARNIEGKFAAQPRVEATIRGIIAETYRQLGEHQPAVAHLERALRIGEQPSVMDPRHRLVLSKALADSYLRLGRSNDAQAIYAKLVPGAQHELGADDPVTLGIMIDQADLDLASGRAAEAEVALKQILSVFEKQSRADDPTKLSAMLVLVAAYLQQGRFEEADRLAAQGLEQSRNAYGEEHPVFLRFKGNLAFSDKMLGRYAEAEKLYVELLAVFRRVLGDDHQDTIKTMMHLADLYTRWGRPADAQKYCDQAVTGLTRTIGSEHPAAVQARLMQGTIYALLQRFDEADELLRRALDSARRVLGEEHPDTQAALGALIDLRVQRGRPDDARPLTQEKIRILRRLAERRDASAELQNEVAWFLLTCQPADLRDPRTALELALQCNARTNHSQPDMLDTLAVSYEMVGDPSKAAETERKALSLLPAGDSPDRREFEEKVARFEAAAAKSTPTGAAPATQP